MPAGPAGESPRERHPALTVDGVVLLRRPATHPRGSCDVLLVQRRHGPFQGKWSLPGGFVEYGEDLATAVQRETAEETGLDGLLFRQFRTYGDPERDPRGHTVSVVYIAEIVGEAPQVQGGDDASQAAWFPVTDLPELAFDHLEILHDVLNTCGF